MQKLVLPFLLLTTFYTCAQQHFKLSGKLTDGQGESILVGDILLFSDEGETLIKYISILEGSFSMEDIPSGMYRLRISCLGFEIVEKPLKLFKNEVVDIRLNESTTNLDEVYVIAAKPIMSNTNGNIKIDISNPVFASIPNPIELLARLPNLQVSADRESVSVIGKGTPLIYMANQRISVQEFNALSVDDISSIEIVRNPSAKYEADGRAVLLITRKISESEGFKLGLSKTLSFKRNFNNYSNFNGSLQTGRVTLKANFAYNDLLQWESHQFEFAIPEANILSDYLILVDKNDREELNAGGGLFYQINDTDYFSANTTYRSQTNNTIIDTDTFLKRDEQVDTIVTETDNDNTKDFISSNLNYNKQLNEKTNIFTGVQYSSYVQSLITEITNNYNATQFSISQNRKQRYQIDVLAYRLDFDKTLANEAKWEVGANISNAKANAITNIEFFENNSTLNIDYDYSERNIAGYTTLIGKLSEKLSFNVGLRVENNTVKGEVDDDAIPLVDRSKTNLFPKANLSFEVDSTKNISFNYAKSITRPNYSNASSIQVFFNPFLEGEGNVNLLPTLTEELSAVFQFAKNSISVEYFKRENPIYYTISYTPDSGTAVFSLKNLEKESGIDINLTVPITKGIWTSSNTVSVSTKRIQDGTAISKAPKPYMYLYTGHQFKMGKETTLSFGGWGLTKRSEGIFKRNGMLVLNAALTKTFFKKLDCTIRWEDITKSMNFEESYAIGGVIADGVYFVDAQEIAFSLKYTFGKKKEPAYKNRDVDENLERIR